MFYAFWISSSFASISFFLCSFSFFVMSSIAVISIFLCSFSLFSSSINFLNCYLSRFCSSNTSSWAFISIYHSFSCSWWILFFSYRFFCSWVTASNKVSLNLACSFYLSLLFLWLRTYEAFFVFSIALKRRSCFNYLRSLWCLCLFTTKNATRTIQTMASIIENMSKHTDCFRFCLRAVICFNTS